MTASKGRARATGASKEKNTSDSTVESRTADSGTQGQTSQKAAEAEPKMAESVAPEGEYTGLQGSETVNKAEVDNAAPGTYTVKDGDSIESIASENGTTPAELVELNPELAGGYNMVYTGQTIRLK